MKLDHQSVNILQGNNIQRGGGGNKETESVTFLPSRLLRDTEKVCDNT